MDRIKKAQRTTDFEFTRQFVATVARADSDGKDEIVYATACDSSVSLTTRGQTIHVPWSEIAAWIALRLESARGR